MPPAGTSTSRSSGFATPDLLKNWPLWLAALWWGSLTTLGFGVIPLLFAILPDKALAGNTAASLLGVQAIASTLLGAALLMAGRIDRNGSNGLTARARAARAYVLAGMLLALLVEFAVAPRILLRQDLALWHSVGTAMLLLQWLCAGASLWQLVKPATSQALRSDCAS